MIVLLLMVPIAPYKQLPTAEFHLLGFLCFRCCLSVTAAGQASKKTACLVFACVVFGVRVQSCRLGDLVARVLCFSSKSGSRLDLTEQTHVSVDTGQGSCDMTLYLALGLNERRVEGDLLP